MDNPPPAHNASCFSAVDIGMDISVVAVSNPIADKALQMFILLKDIIGYARHRAFITNCKQKLAFYVVPNAPLVHFMHAYIVSNGDIRIKALSEAGNQDYYSPLFWESIRPSYDGVVTTTDVLCRLLGSSIMDVRVRSIYVWDMCIVGHGVERCFERIFKWFEVENQIENRPADALDAVIRTDVGHDSLLMRQLDNSTDVGKATSLVQQLSYFPTEDSWLWCGTYLRGVLGDLEGWNREDDGVVDDDDDDDDDTLDPAMVFWRERRESVYSIPRTGAQLTYRNSVSILYIYYAWLSAKTGITIRPTFEFVESGLPSIWHCWMALPIGTLSLKVHSGGCSTRRLANHTVVFMACKFLHQKGVLDDMFLPNLDWSEPALTENQDQDQDQDSVGLPVVTLNLNGDASPREEWSNDVVESYPYPINIADDPWAPVEFSKIPLEEPKRVSSKKRLRDEDTDDSDRVDFSRPLYCAQSVAMLVGISFMKLTISLQIFTEFPNSQESELTQKRSYELHVQKRCISNRRLAMSEVGGEFLWSGLDGGLAMVRLWFSSWKRIETWSHLNDKFRHTRAQALDAASSIVVQDFDAVQAVEQLLGYVFEDKRLLVESLTCRSAPPNYDRLEYLGDTVLELIAAAYWARRLPESQSSASSYLAAVSVCNVTLGVMCLHAGLYRHIQYCGKQSMTGTFDNARVNVLQAKKSPGPYWLQFKISKVLADVMESVFGAVFLDSGCQYAPVCDLFMRLLEPKIRHLGQDVGGERSFKKSRGEFKAEAEALIETTG
ncbi:hypothetical protein BGZ99_007857 [Dissophora globulifera]|uniref:Uncharacterized protein n=1 Tax=Dissophora globulifera TaxID=979702 RepID=A0A9P6RD42_9FUNG|nr:hypothetical protein BGZ99_007857 [Dissophora globulifera]